MHVTESSVSSVHENHAKHKTNGNSCKNLDTQRNLNKNMFPSARTIKVKLNYQPKDLVFANLKILNAGTAE